MVNLQAGMVADLLALSSPAKAHSLFSLMPEMGI